MVGHIQITCQAEKQCTTKTYSLDRERSHLKHSYNMRRCSLDFSTNPTKQAHSLQARPTKRSSNIKEILRRYSLACITGGQQPTSDSDSSESEASQHGAEPPSCSSSSAAAEPPAGGGPPPDLPRLKLRIDHNTTNPPEPSPIGPSPGSAPVPMPPNSPRTSAHDVDTQRPCMLSLPSLKLKHPPTCSASGGLDEQKVSTAQQNGQLGKKLSILSRSKEFQQEAQPASPTARQAETRDNPFVEEVPEDGSLSSLQSLRETSFLGPLGLYAERPAISPGVPKQTGETPRARDFSASSSPFSRSHSSNDFRPTTPQIRDAAIPYFGRNNSMDSQSSGSSWSCDSTSSSPTSVLRHSGPFGVRKDPHAPVRKSRLSRSSSSTGSDVCTPSSEQAGDFASHRISSTATPMQKMRLSSPLNQFEDIVDSNTMDSYNTGASNGPPKLTIKTGI